MSDKFLCVTAGQMYLMVRDAAPRYIGPATGLSIRRAVKHFRPYAIVRPK